MTKNGNAVCSDVVPVEIFLHNAVSVTQKQRTRPLYDRALREKTHTHDPTTGSTPCKGSYWMLSLSTVRAEKFMEVPCGKGWEQSSMLVASLTHSPVEPMMNSPTQACLPSGVL